jgi:hypothetical protein
MAKSMINREKLVLEKFYGHTIESIVLDYKYREYVEVHTSVGSFFITCFDPVSGQTRDWIHIDESVS